MTTDHSGTPCTQVQPVLPASVCITLQSMETVESNAKSCETWLNQFVAYCEKELINPLTLRCNQIHAAFLEEHSRLEQSFFVQAEEWESLRETLANRVRKLEYNTERYCDRLTHEVQSLLSTCNPLSEFVRVHAKHLHTLSRRTQYG